MRIHLISFCLVLMSLSSIAQKSNDIKQSIICQATFTNDDKVTVSWLPKEGSESYNIRYRTDLLGSWTTKVEGITDTFYTFEESNEFPIEIWVETNDGTFASGNILAANNYFLADEEERMLIVTTDYIFDELSEIIEAYQVVLAQEMIHSEVIVVSETTGVPDVKEAILNVHNETPLDYILILGHVAVPYSGDNAIDGHTPGHKGAWVADGYYGEMDGNWTDVSVNSTLASRDANKNIPGDGKFDQTVFPSPVDVAVGRVDFSDLPKLEASELELTKHYLQKNIDYRLGKVKATKRAIIDNNFNLAEGFAQGAIKTFHTFLEPDSISYGNFDQCTSQDYLFTFGAGGGNYQGASGIINTNTLVTDSIQSIFTTIFGSYFGDWDVSNNLLRASLARGSSLITAWSGRPIWYFHPMAMGKSVGEVLLNTQNNNGNYISQFGKRLTHTSLLGDPSLKMYYHQPISDLVIGDDEITWQYDSFDPEVVGFSVYYKQDGGWELLGGQVRTEMTFNLSEISEVGSTQLLIKPVGLISSRSGSYYNEGNGVMAELNLSNTNEVVIHEQIYPNPATEYINIVLEDQKSVVRIVDIIGNLVLESTGQSKIDISNLPSGVYAVKFENSTQQFIKL